MLADKGLAAALEAQARKPALSVEVYAEGLARYPRQIEAAAYFSCLEALRNAAKYAAPTSVRSEPGRGTTIEGRLPVPATAEVGA